MKGLEVGDTLVRLTRGYWKVGDRLEVVAFGEGNKLCWAVLNEPGYSHRHAIELPLDETVWGVDYTAGPTMREPSYDDRVRARQRELEDQINNGKLSFQELMQLARNAGIEDAFPITPIEDIVWAIAFREQPPAVLAPDEEPSIEELQAKYPEVQVFAERMLRELWKNRRHGDQASWLTMDGQQLLGELIEHVGKLNKPMQAPDYARILELTADIGNCALFLMDSVDKKVAQEGKPS